MTTELLGGATALVVGLLACALMRGLARRLGLVDRPGSEAHKRHAAPVPYGGGWGMALALAAGLCAALLIDDSWIALPGSGDQPVFGLILGAAGLWLLGAWDDRRPLPAVVKLLVQLGVITTCVLLGDLTIDHLDDIPLLGTGLAIAWCLLICNAFNLLDHADGLSASTALVATAVLFTAAALSADAGMLVLCAVLGGALVGFLVHNWPPARLYMGDAGALPLGFLIGGGCLQVTFWDSSTGQNPLGLLAPLLVTAVPLYDTAVVVIKRLRRREPVTRGDRRHISHRLQRLGLGSQASLVVVIALQMALAGAALQLRFTNLITAPILIAQVAAILVAVLLLEASRDHG